MVQKYGQQIRLKGSGDLRFKAKRHRFGPISHPHPHPHPPTRPMWTTRVHADTVREKRRRLAPTWTFGQLLRGSKHL